MIEEDPPGAPGLEPKWTSSAKIGIGTALTPISNLWFTISHGILNEVYYPRIDCASIRDMGFLVTDGKDFFSDEKRHARHDYAHVEPGIFAHKLKNSCLEGRYIIEKCVISDPRRPVLLQEVTFIPLRGNLSDYKLFMILAPHLRNAGFGNSGWIDSYKGIPMLFATRGGLYLACSSSAPFLKRSCGYVGSESDPWQDIHKNKQMTNIYSKVSEGNISLGAEIDLVSCGGKFVIALGFSGGTAEGAALATRYSLSHTFSSNLQHYVDSWRYMHRTTNALNSVDKEGGVHFFCSIGVLQAHQGKTIAGSNIASLSIPWGFTKGDEEFGGYHLIWPRDQVQSVVAFLAAGDVTSAQETMRFLLCTQEEDGHWPQNFWVDGRTYWHGIQMDETALPVMLASYMRYRGLLNDIDPIDMVERAIHFILHHGPASMQDRWEENEGYNPYTVATQIAALLMAADYFDSYGKSEGAAYLREIADCWNESIESWLYVKDTPLAKQCGVEGYYVRVAPSNGGQDIQVKNRVLSDSIFPYSSIISVDALALVRFGLRSANDPRMLNTVKVIDALLKSDTPRGPVWHRYNMDGYGEKSDGSPFDGTGIGRGWPLLVGERAHYELAKGDKKTARALLRTMASMAGEGGLFPEQIWDAADIPEKSLFKGHSTGSAKPLAWAHAEYITLLRSIKDDKVFGTPPQTVERYVNNNTEARHALWRFEHPITSIAPELKLRVQSKNGATIRWSGDEWGTYVDSELQYIPELKLYYLDLEIKRDSISFTFRWTATGAWENRDFKVVKHRVPATRI